MREVELNMAPSSPRVRAPLRAGVAFVAAVLLTVAYGNMADLVVLHDHPLPTLVFGPALWVLLALAVTMLVPSDLRSRSAVAWAFGGTGLAVLLIGCVGFAATFFGLGFGSSGRHGDRIDVVSSADGRYQVEVFAWEAVLGEPGWDVVIYRRDGLRGTEASAGCLFSEASADYRAVLTVEAGFVRIATEEGSVAIAFDPTTMRVTHRIPVDLCGGYA
ncbi:hypothetical protein AB0J80_18540 [Actinoplanes sp. NPDC049548]|uniref:hypothetical protein n=1 Tax=Actinoplanes sp. NPDC049548 TaxID=3155152 RepID=UPI00344993F6